MGSVSPAQSGYRVRYNQRPGRQEVLVLAVIAPGGSHLACTHTYVVAQNGRTPIAHMVHVHH